ncbi:hypothetical protein HPB47_026412 [Ixodes persulcatus]|uniref:Uncharacterized protein n=1 Tax=Ixodes persulcatus TaxID=34615 RepID=A0AC60Q0J6_IXOPE|nr:hypothetical protein HPB47_026412 [Ixodes persulcatus]
MHSVFLQAVRPAILSRGQQGSFCGRRPAGFGELRVYTAAAAHGSSAALCGVGAGRPAKGADRSPASWFDPGLYMGTGPGFPWVEAAAASRDGLRDKLLRHDPKNGVEDVCRLPNGVRVNGSVRSRGTLGGKRKKRASATAVCR